VLVESTDASRIPNPSFPEWSTDKPAREYCYGDLSVRLGRRSLKISLNLFAHLLEGLHGFAAQGAVLQVTANACMFPDVECGYSQEERLEHRCVDVLCHQFPDSHLCRASQKRGQATGLS
jgi:hypothetical protein